MRQGPLATCRDLLDMSQKKEGQYPLIEEPFMSDYYYQFCKTKAKFYYNWGLMKMDEIHQDNP
jgi:hypothetical protein